MPEEMTWEERNKQTVKELGELWYKLSIDDEDEMKAAIMETAPIAKVLQEGDRVFWDDIGASAAGAIYLGRAVNRLDEFKDWTDVTQLPPDDVDIFLFGFMNDSQINIVRRETQKALHSLQKTHQENVRRGIKDNPDIF